MKHIDEENIPDFLGGKCTQKLEDDYGPWKEYEVVDGSRPGDIVGIRKKGDPNGKIFTPLDFESLPNYRLKDPQNSVRYYEQHLKQEHMRQIEMQDKARAAPSGATEQTQ